MVDVCVFSTDGLGDTCVDGEVDHLVLEDLVLYVKTALIVACIGIALKTLLFTNIFDPFLRVIKLPQLGQNCHIQHHMSIIHP